MGAVKEADGRKQSCFYLDGSEIQRLSIEFGGLLFLRASPPQYPRK